MIVPSSADLRTASIKYASELHKIGFQLESFQLNALHQMLSNDPNVRVVAVSTATGFGKSIIYTLFTTAYNHFHGLTAAANNCKATVILSPLITLKEDQIISMNDKFNCKCVAIETTTNFKQLFQQINKGEITHLIVCPETYVHSAVIKYLDPDKSETNKVICLVAIDEAHNIAENLVPIPFRDSYPKITLFNFAKIMLVLLSGTFTRCHPYSEDQEFLSFERHRLGIWSQSCSNHSRSSQYLLRVYQNFFSCQHAGI